MKIEEVISLVMTELNRAEEAHPDWPKDDVRAAAVVAEESGELVKVVLDHEEKNTSRYAIITEAVQTAASAIRFLKNFEEKNNG